MKRPPLHLTRLKPARIAVGLTRSVLSHLADIPPDRLRVIELRREEPWLDEAVRLARVLGTFSVGALLPEGNPVSGNLTPSRLLSLWRSRERVPLFAGIDLAYIFGLSDPYLLDQSPQARQLWEIVEWNEREGVTPIRFCPVCQCEHTLGHSPWCLGNNLFGAPSIHEREGVGRDDWASTLDLPEGLQGHGLKGLRKRAGLTQSRMARRCDMATNHYARMERCELVLTPDRASFIADEFGVSRRSLYEAPAVSGNLTVSPAGSASTSGESA